MPPVIPANSTTTQAAPPILVEIRRGAMVESRHRGWAAIVDADGRIVMHAGDIDRPVFPRSAIKPLQALPLVETGAADASRAEPPDLALACASHGGEKRHVERVAAWLARLGLGPADLECGAHLPYHVPSAHALIHAGEAPSTLHHNCSGKHTGVLATARHMGERTSGYIASEHPAQSRMLHALEEMCGLSLADAPRGIDGCGFPQIGIPLRALARGLACFGAPAGLPALRRAACQRLAAAMVAYPEMVAWTGHFGLDASRIAHGKTILKGGAEGVYVAAIPAKGLGLALKIDDGAGRAAEVAMAALLARYAGLDASERAAMAALIEVPVTNIAGKTVGAIAPALNW